MVRGSYCQQVMTFLFFCLQLTARLKLQFQSGTLLFKKSGSAPVTYTIKKRNVKVDAYQTHVGPLQINSLFPVLDSGIFACWRTIYFHYSVITLAAFQAIIWLAQS